MLFLFYFSIFFGVFFFFFSFLDWDPLKSCVMMCLGILFLSCYMSIGVHVWYSYFVVLVFLSGVFSLLTYFCSLSNFIFYYNYYYLLLLVSVFFFLFFFFFDLDFFFFYMDLNFFMVFYDFSYYYVYWIVFVLVLFLSLISIGFDGSGFMREV